MMFDFIQLQHTFTRNNAFVFCSDSAGCDWTVLLLVLEKVLPTFQTSKEQAMKCR